MLIFNSNKIIKAYKGTSIINKMDDYLSCETSETKAVFQYITDGSEPTPPEPKDYSKEYLTFDILSGGTLAFNSNTIYYSLDSGGTWTTANTTTINVNVGDKVLIKATNSTYNKSLVTTASTASFNAEGNIMSVIYGDNFIDQTSLSSSNCFAYFFEKTNIVNAENLILPATSLSSGCYSHMFEGCSLLLTAPELPATTINSWVYSEMFRDCISLTTAPDLLASSFTSYSYNQMFQGCSSLNYIKCLATSFGGKNNWVSGVAANGTFVKHPNASWSSGASGIPNGWTVVDAT